MGPKNSLDININIYTNNHKNVNNEKCQTCKPVT
jgi:hypothetical protein